MKSLFAFTETALASLGVCRRIRQAHCQKSSPTTPILEVLAPHAIEAALLVEEKFNRTIRQKADALSEAGRADLFALAGDLQTVWDHPETDSKTRTRLVRI